MLRSNKLMLSCYLVIIIITITTSTTITTVIITAIINKVITIIINIFHLLLSVVDVAVALQIACLLILLFYTFSLYPTKCLTAGGGGIIMKAS